MDRRRGHVGTLLRRLHARGERLSVAAMPWVAPVYRAMPQVGDVIELPFVRARLDWGLRRRLAGSLENATTPPTCCRTR
jgi:heptosyltransferase-2